MLFVPCHKGTLSEAEIHIIKTRMLGARYNKAKRGELFYLAPCGYVLLPSGEIALDPDEQAQGVVRLVFRKFEELGTGKAVLRYLRRHNIQFPIRPNSGPNRGQLEWRRASASTLYGILRHPIYAGAYSHGRQTTDPRTGKVKKLPMDEWDVLIQDHVPAYITWDQYLANLHRLANNSVSEGPGAPRNGPSILSGVVVCGRCERRMSVHYVKGISVYNCLAGYNDGGSKCQHISGKVLDEFVVDKLFQALSPAAIELSLTAADNIEQERRALHKHWQQRLERAGYEVDRAWRQYDAVDPENRLVARELERRWEEAMVNQRQLTEDYSRFKQSKPDVLSAQERELITQLASDIPSIWSASSTTAADRKTIVRHLVDRVVVDVQGKTEYVDVTIHWKGGMASQHEVIRSVGKYEQLRDFDRIKARIIELREQGRKTSEIAAQLNKDGFRPAKGGKFNDAAVRPILSRLGLIKPTVKKEHVSLETNEWWLGDLARELKMPIETLRDWRKYGWIHARNVDLGSRGGGWIAWVDQAELKRLRRLRAFPRKNRAYKYPVELTTPKSRH